MKSILEGKKLLILGATYSECVLIKRAKELGVYTIVTDNQLDHSISMAKDYADEYWDISWSDIDTLAELCREKGVDGITAGWSEIRVDCLIKLCKRLGLPCYCTDEQLDITRNKRKFKNECIYNGVPVVKEYKKPDEVENFPVIIKPVDRAGSIGISVANNREELDCAYAYAMELSLCKDVIIEDYISDAVKIDSYYIVMDGEIYFVSTDDVIMAANNGTDRIVQSGWVLPSRHHDEYREKVDEKVVAMIRHMGIEYGTLFFSGFANDKGYFAMFETGFRLDGGYLQEYFAEKGYVNMLDVYIYHALLGHTRDLSIGSDKKPELKCATVNIYATRGKIAKIGGFDEIGKLETCSFTLRSARIGQVCDDDKAILDKIGMYYFCSESAEELSSDVKTAYKLLVTTDENGNDMIYDRFDPELVKRW
ncbi:MAG: hypothetical protein E7640_03630 [Ruminococcaceae bacterium]|nr:hypothetical protein [Oscillospiraceae bacterium]